MNDPPLTEAEITRERLALEEAIRKVEAEAARRGRNDVPPRPEPASRNPDVPRDLDAALRPPPRDCRTGSPSGRRPRSRAPRSTERRSVTDEGLKGFRDVIAEAESLGDATAQGAKAARDVFAATPPTTSQTFDRLEPRVEPEGLRTPARGRAAEQARAPEPRVAMPPPRAPEPRTAEPRVPDFRGQIAARGTPAGSGFPRAA